MEEYLAFSLYDTNGDGSISMDEMTKYLEQQFAMMNNSAGYQEDPASLAQRAHQACCKCFQEADINGDGGITFDEFKMWYQRQQSMGGTNSAVSEQDSTLTIDIPDASYCYFHSMDSDGRRLYRSANSSNSSIRSQYKDTFVAYRFVITSGPNTWQILRRYSSLKDFVRTLRSREPSLIEVTPFPPKKLLGVANIDRRRLGLRAYFRGLLRTAALQNNSFVMDFFQQTDAQGAKDDTNSMQQRVTVLGQDAMTVAGSTGGGSIHQSPSEAGSPMGMHQQSPFAPSPQQMQHGGYSGQQQQMQQQMQQMQLQQQPQQQQQRRPQGIQAWSNSAGTLVRIVVELPASSAALDPEGEYIAESLLSELQRATQSSGGLGRARVLTLFEGGAEGRPLPAANAKGASTSGLVPLGQVEASLRLTLGDSGMPSIYGEVALRLLSALQAMDHNGDGFINGFDLGQALRDTGIAIDPTESAMYLRNSTSASGSVNYHRFIELLLQARGEPRTPLGSGNERKLAAMGQQKVSVIVTVMVDDNEGGGGGGGGGQGQGQRISRRDSMQEPVDEANRKANLAFVSLVQSGFDVFKHSRNGNKLARVKRSLKVTPDRSQVIWKRKGMAGKMAPGKAERSNLLDVVSVQVVEPGSQLQTNFLWDTSKEGSYFCLVGSNWVAAVEANDVEERDVLVKGFTTMLFDSSFPALPGSRTLDPAQFQAEEAAKKKAELMQSFKMFDLNHDGFISAFELGQALSQMGEQHSEAEVLDLVRRADANGDGKIDYKEFAELMHGKDDSLAMLEAFRVFDRDGDGLISPYELGQTLRQMGENLTEHQIQMMVAKADTNGDGSLDFGEFRKMMENHQLDF
jgi:Ca2+-binding EF-hand superfamily protein